MEDLGLKWLGISCYLQAMKQVLGETQAFTSFLADRGGMIIFSCFHVCMGYDDHGLFPTSLHLWWVPKCCYHFHRRETWGRACNSVSIRLYFMLLRKPVSGTNHLQDMFLGVHTTPNLPFDADSNYQQVRTSEEPQLQVPPLCPNFRGLLLKHAVGMGAL